MALADFKFAVNSMRQRARLDLAGPRAQPHRASQFLNAAQFTQLIDHAVRRSRIELAGVGFSEAAYIARKFDTGGLHPQANAEIWNFLFARIADSVQHARDAPLAKTTRD